MKTIDTYTCDLPQYAVCPLAYGDYSAMDDDQSALVGAFEASMAKMQVELGATSQIYEYSDETNFTHRPVFGLAADCVELVVTFFGPDTEGK